MVINIQLHSLVLLMVSVFFLATAALVWNRRAVRGATASLATLFLVAAWCFSGSMDGFLTDLDQKVNLSMLTYSFVIFIPVFLYLSVHEILTGREVTAKQLLLLLIFPLVMNVFVWTNNSHHLVWSRFYINDPLENVLRYQPAILFWVGVAFQYSILAYTLFLLIKAALVEATRNRAILLLIAVIFPILTSIFYLAGQTIIPNLDVSAFGFLVTGPIFVNAIDRFGLLEIGTIGRSTYTDRSIDAIIILNQSEEVVEVNRTAERIFGLKRGHNIQQYPQILTALYAKTSSNQDMVFSNNIEVPQGAGWFTFNLRSEELVAKNGNVLGKVLILRDITQAIAMSKGLEEAEIVTVQEAERKRLGKEIHDRISQGLYSLSLFSASAKNHALRGDDVMVMEVIDEINAMAQQVIKETNLLFYELEPDSFYKIGMVKALAEQAEVVSNRYDVKITYNYNFNAAIPLEVQRQLYNTISEINNKVLGFSRPENITVSLTDLSNKLKIEVAIFDNKMIKSTLNQHHGFKFDKLINKLSKIDGKFEIIDTTPGKKFIIVELPISNL